MSVRLGKALMATAGLLLMGGLIAACGGAEGGTAPTEEGAGQGATTVNVVMVESWEKWGFTLDRTEVPAGEVTFEVINDGKFTHELMIYPPRDISPLLEEMVKAAWADGLPEEEEEHGDEADEDEAAHGDEAGHDDEADEDEAAHGDEAGHDDEADEDEAGHGDGAAHGEMIEGLVLSLEGEDELVLKPGESGSFTVNLTPGTYELGCVIVETVGAETFTHHEKGMHTTLTVE
jgi:uncharacterized cupredoxin-like copper-binding protein